MNYYIGVDAGGTKTSAIAYDEKTTKLTEEITGPGNLSVNWKEALVNIHSSINNVINKHQSNDLKGIAIGVAGLPIHRRTELIEQLESLYSVPVEVESDYILAYSSIFNNVDGILLIAGTGVVLYGCYKEQSVKLGGWGHLLGDEGSGYDIVIRTLKKSISYLEETNTLSPIAIVLMEKLGIKCFESIKSFIYNKEKSEIASLAPLIIKEAEKGDEISLNVADEIAQALYERIDLMVRQLEVKRCINFSLMGGVLEKGSIITKKLLNKISKNDIELNYIRPQVPNEGVMNLVNKHDISN